MGMHNFRRTQILFVSIDKVKRASPHRSEMGNRFLQRRKAASRL